MPRSTAVVREARERLDTLVDVHLEAFVNLAQACGDDPGNPQLRDMFLEACEDLDRVLRLRNGLRSR